MSDPVQPWPMLLLGNLASELCLGKMLDKQKNRGTLQPYLRNVNVRWFSFDFNDLKEMRFEKGEEIRYGLQPGDLVICEGGEPGRAAVWKGQSDFAKIQKALHRVRFRPDDYDPCFAMYYLYFGSITNRFAPYYTGTTIKHLTGAALSQIPFPIPPLNEQRRIVQKIEELFSKLDAGVAALERIRAALKRYRAAVLKAAVEGKLTAEWRTRHPAKETATQLLRRILDERRRKWEQEQRAKYVKAGKQPPKGWQMKYKEPREPETSGLPAVPEGWCWASMDQVIQRSEYGTSVKCDYKAEGPPVLRIPNIAAGRIDLGDMKRATVPQTFVSGEALEAGDLLMCRTNGSIAFIGKAALVPETYNPPHTFASYLLRFRFGEQTILPRWVHAFVTSVYGRRFIEGNAASSAGQHNISLSLMHSMPLPMPSLAEQEIILAEIERRLSVVDEIETQIESSLKRASRLRQSILKRAFEGRLVPQDPQDESAELLLQKIRQNQSEANGHAVRRLKPKNSAPRRKK